MSADGRVPHAMPRDVIAGPRLCAAGLVSEEGRFVVLEGADGSGKSAISHALSKRLQARGRDVHFLSRSNPRSVSSFESYVRSVDGLFRSAEQPRASLQLLALAAAGQYTALLESEVVLGIERGAVVIAESWWGKTTARFLVEAKRLGMARTERDEFGTWMNLLVPRRDRPQQHTILVVTSQADRVAWYGSTGRRDQFYGPSGETSNDPYDFGVFTQGTQDLLEQRAADAGWVRVKNHRDTQPQLVAARIEERLSL